MRFYLFALFLVVVMPRARAHPASDFEASEEKAAPELEYNSSTGQQTTNTSVTQEQEDQGIFAKASSLVKVAKRLVPTWSEHLQGLPRIDESVKDAFETLGLKSMPISEDEKIRTHLVVNFFSSPEFKRWAKHAARTNKQDCYAAMFDVLQATFNEKCDYSYHTGEGFMKDRRSRQEAEDGAVRVVVLAGIRFRLYSDENPWHPETVLASPPSATKYIPTLQKFFDLKSHFPASEASLGCAYEVLRLKSLLDPKVGYSAKKLVVEYFKSREFKRWTEHASMLNPQDPYAAMFDVLESVHKEKQAAMILALANESWETRSIGMKLERVQFKRWFLEKECQSDDIPTKVFELGPEEMEEHSRLRHAQGRYSKFLKRQTKKRPTIAPIKMFVIMRPSNKQKEKLHSP